MTVHPGSGTGVLPDTVTAPAGDIPPATDDLQQQNSRVAHFLDMGDRQVILRIGPKDQDSYRSSSAFRMPRGQSVRWDKPPETGYSVRTSRRQQEKASE